MVVGYLFESMSSQLFFYFSLMAFPFSTRSRFPHDARTAFSFACFAAFPGREAPCCLRLIDGLII